MYDQHQEKKITITEIPKDGECGIRAIGFESRNQLVSIINQNIQVEWVKAAVDVAYRLSLFETHQRKCLASEEVNMPDSGLTQLPPVIDDSTRRRYINEDIARSGYFLPGIILRTAVKLNRKNLRIWCLNKENKLTPYTIPHSDTDNRNYTMNWGDSGYDHQTDYVDILFGRNHFDRLEITGFGPDETLEGFEVTLPVPTKEPSSQNLISLVKYEQSSPSSVPLLSSSMPAHPTDPADTGLISWVESLGQTRGRLAPPKNNLNGNVDVSFAPSQDRNKTHRLTQDLMFAYVNQLVVVLQEKVKAINTLAPGMGHTTKDIQKVYAINTQLSNLKESRVTSIGAILTPDFISALSIQRGTQFPNTFGEVVSETSARFLRENPFSLMRQHAVLNSLTKMTLSNEDRSTVNEYLELTYQVIQEIQPVLTALYHQGKALKDSMQSLMDFAQENPDYASLIRVLFLLCFDISRYSNTETRKNLFNNRKLSTLKEWTFNSQTDIAPVDIEAFLRESVKHIHPNDLRLCLAALIEIDAATKFFECEYNVVEHDAQTNAIRIHVGKFMYDYMLPVLLLQSNEPAEMSSIALLSQGSHDTAITFETVFSPNLSLNLSFPTAFSPSMSLALAWGTSSINSITLKTLALLSTEADLSEWFNTLQQKIQEHDRHPVILLNSKMLEVINEFKSKPFNSENNYSFKIIDDVAVLGHKNGVSFVEDFQKIMAYLYALLDFGKAVYYFWHSEYSKQKTTKVSELLKAFYAVTYSAVYYIQHFINILGDILPPLKLSSFDRQKKIAQLEKLQAQVNDFLEFVQTHVISSQETHNDIKTILGNHVDLSSNQFEEKLMLEINQQNNWEFVLGALFTLEHHHKPKVANILSICKYLNVEAARLSDQSSEIWQKLGPNFYSGQDSNSLCRLYSHYANNKPRPVIGCMKIAVFGFAYPSYAAIPANRRLFAGLVIDAFSKIVQISDSSIRDDKILHLTPNEKRSFTEALQYLLESQDILSAEEINACDAIYYNASSLRTDNQDLIDDLWKKAQRQQVVATLNSDVNNKAQKPITHLLGLEIALAALKPQAAVKQQQLAGQQARVEALLVPGDGGERPSDSALPARPASIRAGTKGDLLKEEYQALLDALAAGAFPKQFNTRHVFYEGKNPFKKSLSFVALKNLLHEEIKKKSNNFTIKLNSKQLTDSIEEIYKESVSMKYTEFKNQGDQNPCDTTSILTGKHYNGHTLAVFANRLHIIQNECRDLPVAESDANLTNAAILITSQSSELDALHNMLEFESEDLGPQNGNADRPDSPELNRAVLADAVNKTIDWLLGDNPNSENIPTELKKLIAVNQLTSEGIEAKRTELMAITVDYFKRRLAMIKAGKYRDCLDHINKYRTPKVADELQNFIFRLNFYLIIPEQTAFGKAKSDEEVNTLETIEDWRTLPAYYREFLWAVVESLMSYDVADNRLQIDQEKLNNLKISKIAVALGLYCYVQMTDIERSQNAATLLQTLAQLILDQYRKNKPPLNTLRSKFIEHIETTQKTFSNPKEIGSDINERALDLYCCIYTLTQIEFHVADINNLSSYKLILDQIHNNMRAHPDYLKWHRNILNNRHYDSPVNHLLYHRTTETYTAESAGKFDRRYFQPNLTALQAEGYWWSDDYTNTPKQPSIEAPTFRAEAAVVHILFTLLASKSDDLIEIVVDDVRYYDNKIKRMRPHKQTLSIIDQVGFIFTLCKATENEASPYGRALKLIDVKDPKSLLPKAYSALTRMVDYEGETKQKKRDSHDKEYGLVSAYQVAVLEDIKNILKTNDEMLEGYIKSVRAEEMSPDVFAFICSVLAEEKPESWSLVKRISIFSTSSSTKKSNSNNTPSDMGKKKINSRLYALVFTKQWETIALKQGSDRTSAIEQLEKNIRRYYLFDEYYKYVTGLFNNNIQAVLGDSDRILSLLTILVEYPYQINPNREDVISFVCNKGNDSSLDHNDKVLIQTCIKSAIVEIYGKNIPPTVVGNLQSLSEPLALPETYVERSTEEMNLSLQKQKERLFPVSTFFSHPLRWISSLRAAGDHTDEGQNLLCRGSGGSES